MIETVSTSDLLAQAALTEQNLQELMGILSGPNIDDADIYFQSARHESWVLEDGIIREGGFNIDSGIGMRSISAEKTGFAYSDQVDMSVLTEVASNARAIVKAGQSGALPSWYQNEHITPLYRADDVLSGLDEDGKVTLLREMDAVARETDSRVTQVTASLSCVHENILVATLEGNLVADSRPLVRMNISVIVEENGRREQASYGGGGRCGYQHFIDNKLTSVYAKEAVRQATVNLEAIAAPAGGMPVVLGPGWPGILLHEAVGHGLEGDFNRKGSSAFSGRIGEQVAAKGVTVIDDGTLEQRRGSLSVDDEGTKTQATTLIEDGILVNYMQDRMNARLMEMSLTGNGRRESYAHLPLPRMTNTYMNAGEHNPQEIIESIDKGLYAVNFAGGQVDITSGKFVFSASEAYLIENGKVTTPVKGATLIGNGPESMGRISMIGDDFALDSGVGVCGKEGQGVPVGVGQPTLKIDEITVGGTEA